MLKSAATLLELGRWKHIKTGFQVIAFTRSRCEKTGQVLVTYLKIDNNETWTRSEPDFREKFELAETSLILNHRLNVPGKWIP